MKNLQVYTEDTKIDKRKVHRLIQYLRKEFSFEVQFLSISFISSLALEVINKKHLKHQYATDVITFNYSKRKRLLDGEILISFEDAMRNAKKFRVTYGKELFRLVVHGVLHLLDFDDNNAKNKNIMKKTENKLINKFYFTLLASK